MLLLLTHDISDSWRKNWNEKWSNASFFWFMDIYFLFFNNKKEGEFYRKKISLPKFENSKFFTQSIFQDLEFDLGKKRKETKGKFLAQTKQKKKKNNLH